jgi:putative phage-type endonuclease
MNSNIYDFNRKFTTCEEMDNFYDINRNNPLIIDKNKLSEEKQKLFDQYEFLINLPQPVQKSPEWFALRNDMVTASSCGSVLGECKYQTIKETLLEKVFGKEFKENKFVYHGKKYEKIATMIYEVIYNSKVGEFGLIPHHTINFLGASPDGVSMSLTLDGKPNSLLGRMLEIKCPPARAIKNTGTINGDICPSYYWIQVQIQLECCNLSECDFWQCHLIEYKGEKEFIQDDISDLVHTHSEIYDQCEETEITIEPSEISIDKRIRKGIIIELLPIDRSKIPKEDLVEWYGKYIYPPTLLFSPEEYKEWAKKTVKNIKTLYPEFNEKYKFSRLVYWKLVKSHNELIMRQTKWFEKHYDTFKRFWNRVKYYRAHPDEAKEDIIGQRLSNEVFLLTEQDKIPIVKSLAKYKNIFIKNNTESNNSKNNIVDDPCDVFLSSSDNKDKTILDKPSKKLTSKKADVKKMIKEVDMFQSSEESIQVSNIVAKPKEIKKKTIIKTKENIDEFESDDSDNEKIYNFDKVATKKVISKKVILKKEINIESIKKLTLKEEQTQINKFESPPIPIYKNQHNITNSDDELDLVLITENRKKNNNKKNNNSNRKK